MKPQSWLEAFSQRHLVQLSQFRGYLDDAVAAEYRHQRSDFPDRKTPPGEVLGMGVRDRAIRAAENHVFQRGALQVIPKAGCRGVHLRDRDSNIVISTRRWPDDDSPVVRAMGGQLKSVDLVPSLFPIPAEWDIGPAKAALYWNDRDDMLDECYAVLVRGLDAPSERADIYARVRVPSWAEIHAIKTTRPVAKANKSSFGSLVTSKKADVSGSGVTGTTGP
ncbi:MAG: hypothetical protein ACR2M5_07650 [Nakamurella sp.]